MSNLYELTTEYKTLIDMLSDEELDEDAVNNCLEGIKFEIEKKAEGYGQVFRTLEADYKSFQAEADFYSRKAEVIANNMDKLKRAFLGAMIEMDIPEIKSDHFKFKVCGNGGKQPLEINEDMVPDSFKKVIYETDKAKIREALEKGEKLPFATLKERGKHLSIK